MFHRSLFDKEFFIKIANKAAEEWNLEIDEIIGTGAFGVAFSVKDKNLVIKVTVDPLEAEMAERTRTKHTPGIVRYYNVRRIDSLTDKNIRGAKPHALLMERLEPLKYSEKLSILFNELDGHYHVSSGTFPFGRDLYKLNPVAQKKKIKDDLYPHYLKRGGIPHDIEEFVNMVSDIITIKKTLWKFNMYSEDMWIGNLGFDKNGKLCFFDMGHKGRGGKKLRNKKMLVEYHNHKIDDLDEYISGIIAKEAAKMWNIDIDVNEYDSGTRGYAYFSKDGKYVLKITTDHNEAEIAERTRGKHTPGIVSYYDVRQVTSNKHHIINDIKPYVLLMDNLDVLADDVNYRELIDYILNEIVNYDKGNVINPDYYKLNPVKLKTKIRDDYYNDYVHAFRYDRHLIVDVDDFTHIIAGLVTIEKTLKKLRIESYDLWAGNLGFDDNRRLCHFDIGYHSKGGKKVRKERMVVDKFHNYFTLKSL